MADMDKDFVEYVVKALVANPNDVEVKRSVDDMGVLLELTVNPDDMGKVIGKAGATAKSIRTLLRVIGARGDERVNLKIVEPEGSHHEPAHHEPEAHADQAEAEVVQEEVKPEPEEEKESDMISRTKQEFAELDDLDL